MVAIIMADPALTQKITEHNQIIRLVALGQVACSDSNYVSSFK